MIQSRTHNCNELRIGNVGERVTLVGWFENMRKVSKNLGFVILRDFYGTTQLVVETEEMMNVMDGINKESTISVEGVVRERSSKNANLPTGEIEVVPDKIEILGKCIYNALPFEINQSKDADENARLKYRYLDLRNPNMKKNIVMRSQIVAELRQRMYALNFMEITTPILTCSSPEGARDYLVPARNHPGKFYALPQAPQQFKQILMASGFDRYFQIAPCFRDEDARADRSPGEFYQLDMEMAFASQEDVFSIVEQVLPPVFEKYGIYKEASKAPFVRIPYLEAMDKYGSDKPDLRFGNPLIELTDYFKNTPFRVFQAPYVGAVLFKGGAATPRRQFDAWQDWAKQRGAKGLAYVVFAENGELKGPVAKNLSEEARNVLKEALGAEDGYAVFFAAGRRTSSQELLGAVRVELARRAGLLKPDDFAFTWVVDFPLFKPTDDPDDDDVAVGHSKWTSMHHPFTMPSKDWIDKFDKDPEHAMSDSYDIVCNGNEMGGGSVRIHRDDIQDRVLDVLGITPEEAADKFGFLLEAFKYGAPPHAGIALGWDRTAAILAGADSIRDVIAFPKAGGGRDPLTGAPAPISAEQRAETGVDYDPDEDED